VGEEIQIKKRIDSKKTDKKVGAKKQTKKLTPVDSLYLHSEIKS
jgi:hypothetical protein